MNSAVSAERTHHWICSTLLERILTMAVAQLPPPITAICGCDFIYLLNAPKINEVGNFIRGKINDVNEQPFHAKAQRPQRKTINSSNPKMLYLCLAVFAPLRDPGCFAFWLFYVSYIPMCFNGCFEESNISRSIYCTVKLPSNLSAFPLEIVK